MQSSEVRTAEAAVVEEEENFGPQPLSRLEVCCLRPSNNLLVLCCQVEPICCVCAAMWDQQQRHQEAGGRWLSHHRGSGLCSKEGAAKH